MGQSTEAKKDQKKGGSKAFVSPCQFSLSYKQNTSIIRAHLVGLQVRRNDPDSSWIHCSGDSPSLLYRRLAGILESYLKGK
jgi:hypothetical protein